MDIWHKNDTSINDSNIILHLKKNEEEAFRFIYDKYYDYLCKIADSYLKDGYLAETIVGDIIYNLWEIREKLEITYTLKSYLVRSVRNRCINHLQQEYVRREVSIDKYQDSNAIEELFFIEEKHPLDGMLEKELIDKIEKTIDELPLECSKIFKMSRYDNQKYEEIASELNISINTVKYHMKNALGHLRVKLEDYMVMSIIILTLF